ncbi:MAG: SEC-C metal-binding domain-containing protein, partial [Alphaproteobacteria bacterium]|nr:SEC-C metal-binding domain-containing protein [Alphaproteobacteria bacterium]
YRTAEEKNLAIATLIEECRQRNQPVLVGTVSIEKSESLSELLKSKAIPHQVLNARYHEQEAYIIAQAGRPGAVTIATNMAGRGTDIQLGGNLEMRIQKELATVSDAGERTQKIKIIEEEIAAAKLLVKEAGGLYVIGTERHESRRIDNQLRGRAGRQGDPGASKFFLSLEDDLMRIFGSDRMDSMLQKLGLKRGEAIVHRWINKALEKAQQKVEARNFEIRKNLLKFDDVMNDQRKVIYEQRREIMSSNDISETIGDMRHTAIMMLVGRTVPENAFVDQWDVDGISTEMMRLFGFHPPVKEWVREEGMTAEILGNRLVDAADRKMAEKVANFGSETMRMAEKSLLLQILDNSWKEHLLLLDHLRQGIGLRAYAQRDPLNEYKKEAFDHFEQLLDELRDQVTMVLGHIDFQEQPSEASRSRAPLATKRLATSNGPEKTTLAVGGERISRNQACPCGSGKKYKFCHGAI